MSGDNDKQKKKQAGINLNNYLNLKYIKISIKDQLTLKKIHLLKDKRIGSENLIFYLCKSRIGDSVIIDR